MEEYLKKYFTANWKGSSPIEVTNFGRMRHLPGLFNYLGYKIGAEIGVNIGEYSSILLRRIVNLKLFCIDPWREYEGEGGDEENREKCFLQAKETLKESNSVIIRKYSMDAVVEFDDGSLDFVYIDANHLYSYVKEDLREWSKKVRMGGMVSGHDYHYRKPDVVKAVKEHVEENKIDRWFITDNMKPASYFWMKQ
jgi:hypothetical protein